MEAEHRDQVHRGERHARHHVEVRAVGVVEAKRPHGGGEQLGVHRGRVPVPVLPDLNGREGGLGRAVQAR